MKRYIIKRIIISIATIFVLITATFFMVKLIPGNPFYSPEIPKNVQEKLTVFYGLDKPVAEQYFTYLSNLLHGDFGVSLKKNGTPVVDIIAQFFPTSLKLGLLALVFAQLFGNLFGVLAAQFRGRWPDYVLIVLATLGVALPSMVIGPLMRYLFGVVWQILPPIGWGTIYQAIMPAFVLGLASFASCTRNMRASMLGVTTQDYIKTARAKGLPPYKIVWMHELKNSFVPIMSGMGVSVANVLMGSFVVETIFLVPGLGKYFTTSISTLDYPLIMGLTLFYGTVLVIANFIVDLLYGVVDPHIRLG